MCVRVGNKRGIKTMLEFINTNIDIIGWSLILAPFAYVGIKLMLIMIYVTIANIFGGK